MDIREVPAFLDYLRGGLQVSLISVIDFTGSNGLGPFSLHRIYKDPETLNQSQACIIRVGSILSKYDSTQQYDDLPTKSQLSTYCFPLTLDPEHDTVQGVQGILDAYEAALKR